MSYGYAMGWVKGPLRTGFCGVLWCTNDSSRELSVLAFLLAPESDA